VPPEPGAASGGSITQRLMATRKDSRLSFDDEKPSVSLSLGNSPCLVKLEKSESALTGDQKIVVSAAQIEIKATQKLLLSGAQVEITSSGPLTASGKPIRLN
jgi:hypothetical protein